MTVREADGDGATLGVAMIGYAFMGAAHSQGWRNAHRFFDLPARRRYDAPEPAPLTRDRRPPSVPVNRFACSGLLARRQSEGAVL